MVKIYCRDSRSVLPESETTSRVMSSNKGKDTKPELILRRALRDAGFPGYRLQWKKVPGRPDIAYPGRKVAIFVNGCFWHRCPKCDKIPKEWLRDRVNNILDCDRYAPKAWRTFMSKGRDGIRALMSPRNVYRPTKAEQLPDTIEGMSMIKTIHDRYIKFPQDFEHCAVAIVQMMDGNFIDFDVTRPWRDGGRDAVGKYKIGTEDNYLTIDCALEAKLFGSDNGVGVRQMSRLISRIRYRQFGIFVTTSYIDGQAFLEVKEDGHPIVMITGRDIVWILKSKKQIGADNIEGWLDTIDGEYYVDGDRSSWRSPLSKDLFPVARSDMSSDGS